MYTTNIPATPTEYVDLGLPSGLKWADRNVGAYSPSDYGSYFSWGNVEGVVSNGTVSMLAKDALYTYLKLFGVPEEEIESQMEEIMSQEGWEEMIKTELSGIVFIEGTIFDSTTYAQTAGGQYTGSELDAEHDAATANMGSDWRMPTSAETMELVKGTDHYYIGEDGSIVAGPFNYETDESDKELDGSKLRSICFVKKGATFDYNNRSNFIEFPFAGACIDIFLSGDALGGYVWSSSVNSGSSACFLYFDHDDGSLIGDHVFQRHFGLSVRGVRA